MLPDFLSLRVETKGEALALLSDLQGVKVLAGGTDLLIRMRRGETCTHVVDITGIPELAPIETEGDIFSLGGAVTHKTINGNADIRENAVSLAQACGWVGSPQIRNMGTVGGNLVNASPAADSLPPLLVHDAHVILESKEGRRKVRLEDFILAPYRTSIRRNELLTRIEIEGCKGFREGYQRVTKRAAWAISRLSVAWAIKEVDGFYGEVRLAIGSCTPMPFRAREVERFLAGKEKRAPVITEAVAMAAEGIRRASGERPSFVYKMPVLEALLHEILRG